MVTTDVSLGSDGARADMAKVWPSDVAEGEASTPVP
jgi:hypothetical protein